jgi:16S rRNA G1207 methylase RsmC
MVLLLMILVNDCDEHYGMAILSPPFHEGQELDVTITHRVSELTIEDNKESSQRS